MPSGSSRVVGVGRARLGSVGVGLGVVAFVGLVWATRGELGMTWDEPYFFERQHEIGAWFGDLLGNPADRARAFSRAGLERSWRVARAVPDQHPPVPELLSLVTGSLFGWLVGPLRSYRLATVFVFAGAAAVLVRLVGTRWGAWAAGAGLGALLFNPRLFADAQQITADSDTGACWFLAAVAWLRSCETGRRYWLFGVCAGLAIMCKATGVLLLLPMVAWSLIHRPRGWWRPLAWSIVLVPLVMVVVMPPWWSNPVGGIRRWVAAFLAYPQKVPVFYLGTDYDSVRTFLPWHNTIVLTATMVPLGLLALGLAGVAAALRPAPGAETTGPAASAESANAQPEPFLPDRVVVSWATLNFATWLVLRMFPGLPAHDGLRQLVPSFFFLPVLAAYGAHRLADGSGRFRAWGRVAVVGCVASAGWATLSFHPYELAYYNALIGGPKGARAAGMETTYFWDSATAEVLDWMNRHLPTGSRVLIYPPPNVLTFGWEQRWGRLRPDLNFMNLDPPHGLERLSLMGGKAPCYLLLQMRQGMYPHGADQPGLMERIAESRAVYELVPPRVGVRLLALVDQAEFRRVLEATRTARP